MTIDRALSGNPFGVDQFRCRDAADSLGSFQPSYPREAWSGLPVLSQLVFKTLFISICQRFNWDFLQNAMALWLLPSPEVRLDEIAATRPSDIRRLLASYPMQERVLASERATMLRAAARELQRLLTNGRLQSMIKRRALDGPGGFYETMLSIPAFATDELQKKVRVLAHDLYRERIIVFRDPEHLRPAVEYHILRLYIRTGRVFPTDAAVRDQLLTQGAPTRTRLVRLLRRAVEDAMELTAFYAKLDVATLNHVEWQIGRAVCLPVTPNCASPPSPELATDVAELSPSRCAFAGFCRSYTEPSYGWYHEPHFQKAIY